MGAVLREHLRKGLQGESFGSVAKLYLLDMCFLAIVAGTCALLFGREAAYLSIPFAAVLLVAAEYFLCYFALPSRTGSWTESVPLLLRGYPSRRLVLASAAERDIPEDMCRLQTPDGQTEITLPVEIARFCYDRAEQTVTLSLVRRTIQSDPTKFELYVEMSPPPKHALDLFIKLPSGYSQVLTLPAAEGSESRSRSLASDPVSAAEFRSDEWSACVSFRLSEEGKQKHGG